MALKMVVKRFKRTKKLACTSSLKANIPKPEIEGREFKNIPATLIVPPPEYLQKSDSASTELLKAGAEFHTLSAGYKARSRVLVVSIYAIALFLKHDEAAWISFTRHKQWEIAKKRRPQFEHQQDALGYALRFAVGLTGNADSKQASRYHRALVTWFNEDLPAEEVLRGIEEAGGFGALASANAANKSKTKAKKPTNPVVAVNVGPVVVRTRKEMQSAAAWADDLKSDLADTPGKGLTIKFIVEDNKEIDFLLNANPSDRVKMTFEVENVRGRDVRISNARVKLGKKTQKRVAS